MTTPDIAGLCKKLRASPLLAYRKEAADTLERQAAENKRLRAGLEKVAGYYGPGHRVTEIARAALTGEDS